MAEMWKVELDFRGDHGRGPWQTSTHRIFGDYAAAKRRVDALNARGAIAHLHIATRCDTCGIEVDPDKGEVFLSDDGGEFCNDDYTS